MTLDICGIELSAPRQIIPVDRHSGKLAKTSVTRIHEEIWIPAFAGTERRISGAQLHLPSDFVKRLRIDTSPVQRYSSLRKGHYTPRNRVIDSSIRGFSKRFHAGHIFTVIVSVNVIRDPRARTRYTSMR